MIINLDSIEDINVPATRQSATRQEIQNLRVLGVFLVFFLINPDSIEGGFY